MYKYIQSDNVVMFNCSSHCSLLQGYNRSNAYIAAQGTAIHTYILYYMYTYISLLCMYYVIYMYYVHVNVYCGC